MAKATALIVSAIFILAVAASVRCHEEEFQVEGLVYCDPCRIQFQTKLSHSIEGAKVELKCRNRDTEVTTLEASATTNSTGQYTITVKGDHELEICEVFAKESPVATCSELMVDLVSARVSLTNNNGVKGNIRFASPIGFMVKDAVAQCKEVLDELFLGF